MRSGGFYWRVGGADEHFCDVVASNFHLHGADSDFEMIFVEPAADDCRTSDGLELYRVPLRDMLYQLRLGVGIALIGASGMSDQRGIELLAELAAQFGKRRSESFVTFCARARS